MALTDHDTFDGLAEAAAAAADLELEFVPGIEFSAEFDGASLHVLGYWVDPGELGDRAADTRLTATRLRRGELIVEKLRELGFDVSIVASGRSPTGARSRGRTSRRRWSRRGSSRTRRRPSSATSPTRRPTSPSTPWMQSGRFDLIGDAGGALRAGTPGDVAGERHGARRPDRGDGRRRDGGDRGEPPGPRSGHAGEVRRDLGRLDLVPLSSSDCHGDRYGRRMGQERTMPRRSRS